MKKVLIITFIFIMIITSIFLYNDYRVRHARIEVETLDEVEVQKEIKLSKLIKSINGKLIKDKIIKIDKLGKKKIKFKYINDDNIKVKYSFSINVVDSTPPIISDINSINVYKGSSDDILDRVFCADNYDKNPKCSIEGEYNLEEEGSYNVMFKASDSSNNINTKNFIINVIEKKDIKKEITKTNYDDIYNKFKNENTLIGIDLSYHQGDIDYKKLKKKIDFVFLRIGYGKNRDNKYVLDSKFKENITNFNKLGIPVGVYFFSYDENEKDARESARWVLKQVKKYKISYPIVYDWENWDSFKEYNISLNDLNNMANVFMNEIKKKDYKVMLYSSKNYLKYAWHDNYNVWIAHYNENMDYYNKYKLWQVCDDGVIDGINSKIDIDIMYK